MKKYIAPELNVLNFDAEDIIRTSGVVEAAVPKTVVKGTATQATGYGAKSFAETYGATSSVLD